MVKIAALAVLLGIVVLTPAAADKDRVSDWLVGERPKVVETVTTLRLAMLCQRLPSRLDRATFEDVMAKRVGATTPVDRSFAASAISEGEATALVDFKYAATTTCMNLRPAEIATAADILAGHATLRITDRPH